MTRVFVDIGSHIGQTLEEVVKPRWAFDLIWGIEPMPREFATLHALYGAGQRICLLNAALADGGGERTMYGTNDELEASLYAEKRDADSRVRTQVECQDAGAFFADLPDGNIYVDLNCEGGEVQVLTSLLRSGQIHRITAMLMSFDIRKVPGQEHREAEVREAMRVAGFDRYTATYPDRPTHQEQIAAWLEGVGL